jgi:hypothetical protein
VFEILPRKRFTFSRDPDVPSVAPCGQSTTSWTSSSTSRISRGERRTSLSSIP